MRSAGCEPVLLEGFLDAPGGGMGSDALIDGECLLQVGGGLAAVPVVEVAAVAVSRSPMLLSMYAWTSGSPVTPNTSRACWWLAAAAV